MDRPLRPFFDWELASDATLVLPFIAELEWLDAVTALYWKGCTSMCRLRCFFRLYVSSRGVSRVTSTPPG